jgi:tetratricopeptide (TPR) repeat protein
MATTSAVPAVGSVASVTALTPDVEKAIALGYERRERANMAPTIAYFEELLAQHPDHPVLTYEVAGAYDSAGEEAKAKGLYERALELGVEGEPRRRCLCQYGSTLRWLGELHASLAVLERARAEFPESESVRVFQALTLNELGRADEAVGLLLGIIAQHGQVTDLGRYAAGLGGLAQWLLDGRPEEE